VVQDFGKELNLKQGIIKTRVRGDLIAIVWKDKRDVEILMDVHFPPAEGNFCDEGRNTQKPATVQDYNGRMGYVYKIGCMTDIYSLSRQTWTLEV